VGRCVRPGCFWFRHGGKMPLRGLQVKLEFYYVRGKAPEDWRLGKTGGAREAGAKLLHHFDNGHFDWFTEREV
jgi:hypothetical protein